MSFTNETEKQKYYIQKCKELVKIKEQQYGENFQHVLSLSAVR